MKTYVANVVNILTIKNYSLIIIEIRIRMEITTVENTLFDYVNVYRKLDLTQLYKYSNSTWATFFVGLTMWLRIVYSTLAQNKRKKKMFNKNNNSLVH